MPKLPIKRTPLLNKSPLTLEEAPAIDRARFWKALRAMSHREKATRLFNVSREMQKNPPHPWFFEWWKGEGLGHPGDRCYFVTDFFIPLLRNLHLNYVVELFSEITEERALHYKKRGFQVFLVQEGDTAAFKHVAQAVRKIQATSLRS